MQQKLIIYSLYSVFCILYSVLRPLHLSRTLYKSATFYAKQTQFPGCSNELKLIINKGLRIFYALQEPKKQTQFKPKQTQFP